MAANTAEDAFEVADAGLSKHTQSAINRSLDRIQEMVDTWQPLVNRQDFAVLSMDLVSYDGTTVDTGIKPLVETPIFATSPRYSGYVYIGRLMTNGTLVMEGTYGQITVYQYIRI